MKTPVNDIVIRSKNTKSYHWVLLIILGILIGTYYALQLSDIVSQISALFSNFSAKNIIGLFYPYLLLMIGYFLMTYTLIQAEYIASEDAISIPQFPVPWTKYRMVGYSDIYSFKKFEDRRYILLRLKSNPRRRLVYRGTQDQLDSLETLFKSKSVPRINE